MSRVTCNQLKEEIDNLKKREIEAGIQIEKSNSLVNTFSEKLHSETKIINEKIEALKKENKIFTWRNILSLLLIPIVVGAIGGFLGLYGYWWLTTPNAIDITSAGYITNDSALIEIRTTTEGPSSNKIWIYAMINGSEVLQLVETSQILTKDTPLHVKIPLVKKSYLNDDCLITEDGMAEFQTGKRESNSYWPLYYKIKCDNCKDDGKQFYLLKINNSEEHLDLFTLDNQNIIGCEHSVIYYFWENES